MRKYFQVTKKNMSKVLLKQVARVRESSSSFDHQVVNVAVY